MPSRVSSVRLPVWLFLALVACLLTGCPSSEKLTKAGGIVKLNGEPLETGTVEFYPVGGGRTANAVIESDGTFTISYRQPGDGLPPGEYKVAVISVKDRNPRPKQAVASEVNDVDSSAADFAPSGSIGGVINIVPTHYNSIERTPLRQTVVDDGKAQYLEIEITTKSSK